jgi:hypothetical protein
MEVVAPDMKIVVLFAAYGILDLKLIHGFLSPVLAAYNYNLLG